MRRDKILNFRYQILIKKVEEKYSSRDSQMPLKKFWAKSVKRFLRNMNVNFWAVWYYPLIQIQNGMTGAICFFDVRVWSMVEFFIPKFFSAKKLLL